MSLDNGNVLELGRRLAVEVLEPMKRTFVGKDEIIDLMGLVTPEILPYRREGENGGEVDGSSHRGSSFAANSRAQNFYRQYEEQ